MHTIDTPKLPARLLSVLSLCALLAGCGGGAKTVENPATGGGTPPTYSGPPPATADVQSFKINVWDNLKASNRPDHPFTRPDGLTQVEVCDLSGLLPIPTCPHTRTEWFIYETEPKQTDSTYQQIWIDTLTNSLANDSTPIGRRKSITVLDLPMEAQEWAHEQGLPLLADYSQTSENVSQQENQLVLLSPHPSSVYRIDPNFAPSAQQLRIEVAVGNGISQVTIWVDGNLLLTLSSPPYQAWWSLSAGEHRFWAEGVSMNGERVKSDVVTITVSES